MKQNQTKAIYDLELHELAVKANQQSRKKAYHENAVSKTFVLMLEQRKKGFTAERIRKEMHKFNAYYTRDLKQIPIEDLRKLYFNIKNLKRS